jgi:outer membrane protein OmpA-like peptidoglycan-associated protein
MPRWVWLTVVLVLGGVQLSAQLAVELRERVVLPSGDTLLRSRVGQPWWVGIGGGATGMGYVGRLNLPRFEELPERGLLPFRGGFGNGWTAWVLVGWTPPEQRWGAILRLSPIEVWRASARFTPVGTTTGQQYELDLLVRTFLLSASARYTPHWSGVWAGLHFLGGVDARFLWNARERVRTLLHNTERIEEWRLLREQPLPMSLGLHVGAGLDFVVALMGERARVVLSPHVLLQTALPVQRTWGSNWTPLGARVGLQLKVGWDTFREELRRLDTSAISPVLAAEGKPKELPLREQLWVGMPPIAVLLLPQEEQPPPPETVTPPAVPAVRIVPNRIERFLYPSERAVALTPELRRYLDALAEYLRANPQAEVRIVGHTDDFGGGLEETQRISEQRAQAVVEYLVQRGISRARLLASGMGTRQPIADNRTAAGRAQNRRVEIVVVQ